MANNLRVIKKDVIYLINEVISDCWLYICLHNDKATEAAEQIISDAIDLGDNMFDQINHYPKKSRRDTKEHFNALNKKLISEVDGLFKRISALSK